VRRATLALVLPILAMSACRTAHDGESDLPYYRSAAMTPEWLSAAEADAPDTHRVAAFHMSDQNGRAVTEGAFAGRVTVVHFFFTTCGDVCPSTTRNIAKLLRELRGNERVQVLSYSVAPERDSVGALREFAAMHHITDPRWRLLTGPRSDVERLARESYFVRLGDGSSYGVATIAHTESLLLVDGRGRLRGVYAGTLMLEVDRLKEDVQRLAAPEGGVQLATGEVSR